MPAIRSPKCVAAFLSTFLNLRSLYPGNTPFIWSLIHIMTEYVQRNGGQSVPNEAQSPGAFSSELSAENLQPLIVLGCYFEPFPYLGHSHSCIFTFCDQSSTLLVVNERSSARRYRPASSGHHGELSSISVKVPFDWCCERSHSCVCGCHGNTGGPLV